MQAGAIIRSSSGAGGFTYSSRLVLTRPVRPIGRAAQCVQVLAGLLIIPFTWPPAVSSRADEGQMAVRTMKTTVP